MVCEKHPFDGMLFSKIGYWPEKKQLKKLKTKL